MAERRPAGAWASVLSVALAGAVLLALHPASAQAPPPGLAPQVRQLSAETQRLRDRVNSLAEDLKAVIERGEAAAAAGKDAEGALEDRLVRAAQRADQLESEVAAMAGSLDATLRDALQGMMQRLVRLEQDLAAVQQRAAAAAGTEAALGRLAERTERLEREGAERARHQAEAAAGLADRLSQAGNGFADRTGRLEKELAALAQQSAGAAGEAQLERLLAAAVHLAATAQTARPFGRELAYVRQMAEGVPALDTPIAELLVHAVRGAPTLADLRSAFRSLAPEIVARAGRSEEGWLATATRWGAEAAARFGVVDPPPLPPTRAAVRAADAHLARGQLTHAVSALDPLESAALDPAAAWMSHARSRLAVDQASVDLVNRTMALLLTR